MSLLNDTEATVYPAEYTTPIETNADQLATTELPEKICTLLPGRNDSQWSDRFLLCK